MCFFLKRDSMFLIVILLTISIIIITENDAFSRKRHRRYFAIAKPEMTITLSSEFDKEKRETPKRTNESEGMSFRELLILDTKGWIYHPELVSYNLTISPSWSQSVQESVDKNKSKNFAMAYSTFLAFLDNKPYSFGISSSRSTATTRSNFAEESEVEITSYSGILQLENDVLPTFLQYSYRESEQTGFFTFLRKENLMSMSMKNKGKYGNTNLQASYRAISSLNSGSLRKNQRQQYSLTNRKRFNGNRSLLSRMNYFTTGGDSTVRKRFNVREIYCR